MGYVYDYQILLINLPHSRQQNRSKTYCVITKSELLRDHTALCPISIITTLKLIYLFITYLDYYYIYYFAIVAASSA